VLAAAKHSSAPLENPDAFPLDVVGDQQKQLRSALGAAKAKLAKAKADIGQADVGLETAQELLANLPLSCEKRTPKRDAASTKRSSRSFTLARTALKAQNSVPSPFYLRLVRTWNP
jgi:hypothetical protein